MQTSSFTIICNMDVTSFLKYWKFYNGSYVAPAVGQEKGKLASMFFFLSAKIYKLNKDNIIIRFVKIDEQLQIIHICASNGIWDSWLFSNIIWQQFLGLLWITFSLNSFINSQDLGFQQVSHGRLQNDEVFCFKVSLYCLWNGMNLSSFLMPTFLKYQNYNYH